MPVIFGVVFGAAGGGGVAPCASQLIASDGAVTFGGVRALRLRADGRTLLSGGADGVVLSWHVTEAGDVGAQAAAPMALRRPDLPGVTPAIRALDCEPGRCGRVVVAAVCCDDACGWVRLEALPTLLTLDGSNGTLWAQVSKEGAAAVSRRQFT
jgi:hypothetical protein